METFVATCNNTGANCVNSMTSKNWGIWCMAGHFLLVLKILLKMAIVRMRQDNSAPGTYRHSELHIAMDRWQVNLSKN